MLKPPLGSFCPHTKDKVFHLNVEATLRIFLPLHCRVVDWRKATRPLDAHLADRHDDHLADVLMHQDARRCNKMLKDAPIWYMMHQFGIYGVQ